MSLDRLRIGEVLAGVGALAIIVSLFVAWISPETIEVDGLGAGYVAFAQESSQTGFSGAGLAIVALVVIVALIALTLVVLTVAVEPVGLTIASAVVLTFTSIIVAVVVLARLVIWQPDFGVGLPDAAVQLSIGAYLTLAGVLMCAAGGWLTMRDERMSAPYSAPPVLEPRPSPRSRPRSG